MATVTYNPKTRARGHTDAILFVVALLAVVVMVSALIYGAMVVREKTDHMFDPPTTPSHSIGDRR